jgi:Uma2 family endonuclease
MAVQEKLITAEEFWEIAQLPENADKRLELIDGAIHDMPPSSKLNTILAVWIAHLLISYVVANYLGYVTGADGGYQLGPHDVRLPDVGFIAKARAAGLSGTVFPVAPDLAVEVISPSETSRAVLDKARAYLQAGTRSVWAVYPEDQVVDVYRLADDGGLHVQTVGKEGTLDGADALPGFTLAVSDVFARLQRPTQETTGEERK